MARKHRVHRWRIASRELTPPGRILYCCGYRLCDATIVYDLRKVAAKDRRIMRAFLRIFGNDVAGQMETGL